ncbi:hypothetical protein MPER_04055 [Moniliophthora perniciosa FA553]|nr:hypothetical protein MPER_04055 [Moniliophthora perniciosa FA553]
MEFPLPPMVSAPLANGLPASADGHKPSFPDAVKPIAISKNGKKRGMDHKCESCSKHRWEHTPHWRESSKYVLSKHQQVQLLEAAAILSHFSQDSATGTSLPEDRSLWPSFLSGAQAELRVLGRDYMIIQSLLVMLPRDSSTGVEVSGYGFGYGNRASRKPRSSRAESVEHGVPPYSRRSKSRGPGKGFLIRTVPGTSMSYTKNQACASGSCEEFLGGKIQALAERKPWARAWPHTLLEENERIPTRKNDDMQRGHIRGIFVIG